MAARALSRGSSHARQRRREHGPDRDTPQAVVGAAQRHHPAIVSGRDSLRQSSVARYGLASPPCLARPLRCDRPTDGHRGLLGAEAVDSSLDIGEAEAQTTPSECSI